MSHVLPFEGGPQRCLSGRSGASSDRTSCSLMAEPEMRHGEDFPFRWVTCEPVFWQHLGAMGGTGTIGGVTLRWAEATDVGRTRSVNEDAVFAGPPLFVVADGMGGHSAGDVAAGLVVERLGLLVDVRLPAMKAVVEALRDVNAAILQRGQSSVDQTGMGTTAVGLVFVDNGERVSLMLFNIGDSRAYLSRDGRIEQLSIDHSFVQELVDAGELTASDARTHPERNVVTRALGVADAVQADYWLRAPAPGERYLLCSDGLTGEVEDAAIGAVLARSESPEDAAIGLVEAALAAGGRDNVSVVVLDVVRLEDADGATSDTAPRIGSIDAVPDAAPAVPEPRPAADMVDLANLPGRRSRRGRRRQKQAAVLIDGIPDLPASDESAEPADMPVFEPADSREPDTLEPDDG